MSLVEEQKGLSNLIPCNDICGGDYPSYSFGQTDKEVNILIPLNADTNAKMLSVEIMPMFINITHRRHNTTLLSGKLYRPIKAEESTWFLEDHKVLNITLVKTNLHYEEWWPLVVEGEVQIDMKTFKPPPVHISELDEGAQATIARMMWEQREKHDNVESKLSQDKNNNTFI